jgi:hypothetical protein
MIKAQDPSVLVLVDNCYGEFTEEQEPTAVGAGGTQMQATGPGTQLDTSKSYQETANHSSSSTAVCRACVAALCCLCCQHMATPASICNPLDVHAEVGLVNRLLSPHTPSAGTALRCRSGNGELDQECGWYVGARWRLCRWPRGFGLSGWGAVSSARNRHRCRRRSRHDVAAVVPRYA